MTESELGVDLQRVRILTPKTKHELCLNEFGPLFFLAGPVRGGGDWQLECCRMLSAKMEKCQVAIPYWHGARPPFPLVKHSALAEDKGEYDRQLDWERSFIWSAMRYGCLIFWLPAESKTNPRGDGCYARDTRGELGRYGNECGHNTALRMVVGGEEDFDGLDLIRRNLFWDRSASGMEGEYQLPTTLEETVDQAIALARR